MRSRPLAAAVHPLGVTHVNLAMAAAVSRTQGPLAAPCSSSSSSNCRQAVGLLEHLLLPLPSDMLLGARQCVRSAVVLLCRMLSVPLLLVPVNRCHHQQQQQHL